MPVNTENAVLAFGRSLNPQRATFPTRQVGFVLDRLETKWQLQHIIGKRTRSLRSFSRPSLILDRENNRIPVGSQHSERAAIKWSFLLTKVGSCRRIFAAPSDHLSKSRSFDRCWPQQRLLSGTSLHCGSCLRFFY